MDDLVQRLDALLRSVAEVPRPAPAPAGLRSGQIDAARRHWEARRLREQMFGPAVFGDCAWGVVLDLFIATEEGREVTLSSICEAMSLPPAVVLRSLATLIEMGLVLRETRAADAPGVSLLLSDAAFERLRDYFSQTR
jgi:hypothetical protein